MKKILLFLFVFSLIFSLAFPVFASEFYFYDFNSNPIFYDSIPSIGNYSCLIDVFYLGQPAVSIPFTGSVYYFSSVDPPSYFLYFPPIDFFGQILSLYVMWIDVPDAPYCVLMSENGDVFSLPDGYTFHFTIKKIHNPSFSDSINFGLSSVMSWIQSFVSAFLSGELSPLLTVFVIGICVAALFFGIRSIYKFCWGC